MVTRAEAIARQLGAGDALEAVVEAVIEEQPKARLPPPLAQAGAAKAARKLGNGRAAAEAAEAPPPPPPA